MGMDLEQIEERERRTRPSRPKMRPSYMVNVRHGKIITQRPAANICAGAVEQMRN